MATFPKLNGLDEDSKKIVIYKNPPKELLIELTEFNRIKSAISGNWGTIFLKEYLENLLSDTRGNTRQGFPPKAGQAILKLHLEHIKYLESLGVKFGDITSGADFVGINDNTKWKVPKNF